MSKDKLIRYQNPNNTFVFGFHKTKKTNFIDLVKLHKYCAW